MPNEVQPCVLRTLSTGDQGDELSCLAVPCACERELITQAEVAAWAARANHSPRVEHAIHDAAVRRRARR